MSNIIVGYYFDIKKISGEFGVSPATVQILRPATFLENAQNFDQNDPKYASGIDFTSPNVARYWCNTKKNNTKFLYASTLSHYKDYLPERNPATGELWPVSQWNLVYEQKPKFQI